MTNTPMRIYMNDGTCYDDEIGVNRQTAMRDFLNSAPNSELISAKKGIYRISNINAIIFGKEREE